MGVNSVGLPCTMSSKPLSISRFSFYSFLFLSTLICVEACHSDQEKKKKSSDKTIVKASVEINNVVKFLTNKLDDSSSSIILLNDTLHEMKSLREMYSATKYYPFWLNEEGVSKKVSDYITILADISNDGLQAEDYNLSKIRDVLEGLKSKAVNESEIGEFELLLTASFLKLSNDMMMGKDTVTHKKDWKIKNDSLGNFAMSLAKELDSTDVNTIVAHLRPEMGHYNAFRNEYKRLDMIRTKGGWPKVTEVRSESFSTAATNPAFLVLRKRLFIEIGIPKDTVSMQWNEDLVEAIRKFQHLNYIKLSGKPDTTTINKLNINVETKLRSLALNMERLRWMKQKFPQPYIWVDVPKMEVDYVEDDKVQFNMRVVVGRPGRPTTMLVSPLANIVFNPTWTVPPTIMKEDVIPGVARRGGSYLSRRGLKAYDSRGRVVNASAITRKNFRNYRVGQAPGHRNSLGHVKFNLPNPWSIYLHDTPHREDFPKFYRALSSGCIRVHHPKEFAAFLLRDSTKYSAPMIDSIVQKRKTIFVPVERNIDVHIVYLTNALDSTGQVMYLKDIYKWD